MGALTELILLSIPGIYFISVIAAWFAAQTLKHGLIIFPSDAYRVVKPLILALAFGVIPGGIVGNIVWFTAPDLRLYVMIPILLGAIVSGVYLHRELLNSVYRKNNWNIAVAILTIVMAIFNVVIVSKVLLQDFQ